MFVILNIIANFAFVKHNIIDMSEDKIENRVIFTDDPEKFRPKIMEVDGELIECYPTSYRRTFRNETEGITIEYSLTPFPDNETAKKGDPR